MKANFDAVARGVAVIEVACACQPPKHLRVLEISRPCWTAYDAAYVKLTTTPNVPKMTQERAFTSPIWYSPR